MIAAQIFCNKSKKIELRLLLPLLLLLLVPSSGFAQVTQFGQPDSQTNTNPEYSAAHDHEAENAHFLEAQIAKSYAEAMAYIDESTVTFANADAKPAKKKKQNAKYYRVNAGDTVYSISKKKAISMNQLRQWNPQLKQKQDYLNIGDRLIVGLAKSSSQKGGLVIHKVKRGENLNTIAQQYQVSVKEVVTWNKISNPNLLSVGTSLKIYVPASTAKTFFKMPVKGRLTSRFGYRKNPFTGKKSFHKGIDLAAPSRTPFYASQKGYVAFAGRIKGYGNCIFIVHSKDYMSVYAHARKNLVVQKQRVKKGQKIGLIGTSGYSTGPHLHFEIRSRRRPIDPLWAIENLQERS